jgi:hypothetical protein
MKPLIALLVALAAVPASGQPTEAAKGDQAEPVVQRISIDEDGSRIDELRVRGRTQRITVQPKLGRLRPYEIMTGDGSGVGGDGHGSAGKRVWQVLAF